MMSAKDRVDTQDQSVTSIIVSLEMLSKDIIFVLDSKILITNILFFVL